MRKTKQVFWTSKCQATWELIKQKYVKTPILIYLNQDLKFHVHIYAYLLIVGAMLAQNLTRKHDQLIVYASRLLNNVERNYSTIEHAALAMVFVVHKFRHYLMGNKFVFYVHHMVLVYLVNKSQVLERIAIWLLLFLEYEFTIVYKLGCTPIVADALSRLPNII